MQETGKKEIVYIAAEHIRPHPDNLRKNLGDLSELTESIRKNGIMQNLTVIPIEEEPGEYMTLIGHRRYMAGKAAGITEFPCQITAGLSAREQISIMLEENMQRSDLTIWEQANGFQLMLDLGETEESIAQKTGFSKTTVKHRLNIAKLDQKVLKEKEGNEGFQLTLSDLYALEKVEDIATRNKILENARDSKELAWKVQQELDEAKRKKNEKTLIAILKELGVEKEPQDYESTKYHSKWETVKYIDLDREPPNNLQKETLEGCFYHKEYRNMKIVRRKPKVKKEESEQEKARKEVERRQKKIKAMVEEMTAQRADFVRNIANIKRAKNEADVMEEAWKVITEGSGRINQTVIMGFLAGKEYWSVPAEEREHLKQRLEETSAMHQMLIIACETAKEQSLVDYYGKYKKESGALVERFTLMLTKYGFSYSDAEYIKIMFGTHELYVK